MCDDLNLFLLSASIVQLELHLIFQPILLTFWYDDVV
jgi:hypothetical protein